MCVRACACVRACVCVCASLGVGAVAMYVCTVQRECLARIKFGESLHQKWLAKKVWRMPTVCNHHMYSSHEGCVCTHTTMRQARG